MSLESCDEWLPARTKMMVVHPGVSLQCGLVGPHVDTASICPERDRQLVVNNAVLCAEHSIWIASIGPH